ncbi:hypothetical protein CANARDRAFT_229004 [[Candida] arabinofermentans NRRL YB-2248]|uniref:candidapepsin n=1 Tax=[Candida] arabinofermentans NRRL YB-2248 TaxID=983967 RepID=A0A1E4T8Z7_9ASCO|nr:hypothetical protein CANARDRAFT_229004 [[Candida] arabinofermentans NRRL YB-2248]
MRLSSLILPILLTKVSNSLPLISNDEQQHSIKSKGYVKLNTQKYQGSSFKDSDPDYETHYIEKRSDNGTVEMVLTNESTFYKVSLEIGSDKQTVDVLVDTGSSDLWIMNSNNTYCESSSDSNKLRKMFRKAGRSNDSIKNWNTESNGGSGEGGGDPFGPTGDATSSASSVEATIDCSLYGTFDPSSSTSYKNNGSEFTITYADDTFAQGWWGYDNVIFDDLEIKSFSFAVADETDSEMGVLGIGMVGLETTYSGNSYSGSPYTYQNLPTKLRDEGFINKVTYSIYLNDTNSNSGSILFGAIDHDKYTGELSLVPIINTLESSGYDNPIKVEITLTSLSLISSSTETTIGSGAAAALLDTGTTLTYVPSNILSSIVDSISDLSYSSTTKGYVMSCDSASDYTLNFNFQGSDIDVPLSSFMLSLTTTSGSSSNYCALGLYSSDDDSFILGDSFLRSIYFVVDQEDYQIAFAPVNSDSNSENIETITSSIPSATSVSAYSETWGSAYTELETGSYGTTSTNVNKGTSTKGSSKSTSTSTSSSGSSSSSNSGSSSSSKSEGVSIKLSSVSMMIVMIVSMMFVMM